MAALEKQGTEAQARRRRLRAHWNPALLGRKPGGTIRRSAAHDSAGINLEAAKWLVEEKGAIMVGSDTSGLEVGPGPGWKHQLHPGP